MTKSAKCALCKSVAPLQRSHVIPKFTNKRIKKEDGRLLRFSKLSHPDGDRVQDAFVEKLLCADCEALFQKWEDHASRMINQRRVFDFAPTTGRRLVKLTGFDYAKMKLFSLSILWRMGAAVESVFSSVDLGPHLDRIGKMLLNSDPGSTTDYGCSVMVVHIEGERMALTRPGDSVMFQTQNLRMYRALIDGLLFAWIVGSKTHMSQFRSPEILLQLDGTWVSYTRDWQQLDFLRSELGKIADGSLTA
jgi:hypothetical protein